MPFGLTVSNVEIPSPGVYYLVLWIDNVEKKTYRMRVIQTPMVPMVVSAAPGPGAPTGS